MISPRSVRPGGRIAFLTCCAALCGCATLWQTEHAADVVRIAVAGATVQAEDAAVERAFDAAGVGVRHAVATSSPEQDAIRREAMLRFVAEEDWAAASMLAHFWHPEPSDFAGTHARLQTAAATGRLDEATEQARALATSSAEDAALREAYLLAHYALLAESPERLDLRTLYVASGGPISALEPFDGSSSEIFRVRDTEGTVVGVWKPHQSVRHQSYRGEVATYRLCAMLGCALEVPRSLAMWVAEEDFYALTGLAPDASTQIYSRWSEILWTEGPNGRGVWGVYKDWVPAFSRFAIEYTDVWRPLLRIGVRATDLEAQRLQQALAPFATRERGFFGRLMEQANGATAFDLARQLSDLHVLDALINNFDRYQSDWPGMNCHYRDGRILSLDNGASFTLPAEFNERVTMRRLTQVQLFSRSLVDALRWMPESAGALLLPDVEHFDDTRARREAFFARRDAVLAYIDGLVAEHGEAAVFVFP